VGRDVTENRQIAAELRDSEARFRELADSSPDMVFRFLLDPVPHFDYLSPSVETLTGYRVQQLMDDFSVFVGILDENSQALIAGAASGEVMPERSDIRGRRADGSDMVTEVHFTMIPGGLQGVGSDVTEIRKLQAELAEQALHDALTGLANRHLVDELMAVGLARAERQGTPLAVAFVDLDDFKSVNDTYGHDAGDAVLREAARRMLEVARSADIVARIGGDEFLIVFEPNQSGLDNLVARVDEALAAPIDVAPSVEVTCPASIGYADTRTCGRNSAALLAAADADMYRVKRAHGRGGRRT
jgi:diguanylate cyclase (GGDEF)-like protein/PAS domain S-box-containing protein